MNDPIYIRCKCGRRNYHSRTHCKGFDRKEQRETGCGESLHKRPRPYWVQFKGKMIRVPGKLQSAGPVKVFLSKLWAADTQAERDRIQNKTPAGAYTFGQIAEACWEAHLSSAKAAREFRRQLDQYIPAEWSAKPAHEIDRAQVRELLDTVMERGPVMANRIHTLLNIIFNWAVKKDRLAMTPMWKLEKPHNKEKARERVLSEAEIRTFWHEIGNSPKIGPVVTAATRMILVTAQRPGEVCALHDDQIEGSVWTMPETKNGKVQVVPLSSLASELLIGIPRAGGYVFSTRQDKAITRSSPIHAIGDVPVLREMGFTAHDLRRTAITRMAEMGVPRHIYKAILNHTEPGATAVYQQYEYLAEKREALEAWAQRLREVIGGGEQVGSSTT